MHPFSGVAYLNLHPRTHSSCTVHVASTSVPYPLFYSLLFFFCYHLPLFLSLSLTVVPCPPLFLRPPPVLHVAFNYLPLPSVILTPYLGPSLFFSLSSLSLYYVCASSLLLHTYLSHSTIHHTLSFVITLYQALSYFHSLCIIILLLHFCLIHFCHPFAHFTISFILPFFTSGFVISFSSPICTHTSLFHTTTTTLSSSHALPITPSLFHSLLIISHIPHPSPNIAITLIISPTSLPNPVTFPHHLYPIGPSHSICTPPCSILGSTE